MKIIQTNFLNKIQKDNFLFLQDACKNHDHISLTVPMEEDCHYYLLYNGDNLLSALCTFFNENRDYECYAFTHPSNRKLGLFRRLLKELLKETKEYDLLFPIEESCKDALYTLKAIQASYWYREYMMDLLPSDFNKSEMIKYHTLMKKITVSAPDASNKNPTEYTFYKNGIRIGSCFLEVRKNTAYFYGFKIRKDLRNQGLGSACFFLFLQSFFKSENTRNNKILLQVSGQNQPAMLIYQKAGFRISESLSYYIY